MKNTLLLIFLTVLTCNLYAQERLTGLTVNARVKESSVGFKSMQVQQRTVLPFFDDFSDTKGIFPNPQHWTDKYVFINDDYAVNPPTVGVATFDAIDNFGKIFPQASPYTFSADTLTSIEIRLDSLFTTTPRKIVPADSVYLSFFYQPQGLGNVPAATDSLILEFLAPDEDIIVIIPADTIITGTDTTFIEADTIIYENWVRVWGASGETLNSFAGSDNLSWFKQVFVPVLDSARFYKPDFRFRFINYASLSDATLPDWQSNGDQWNVDYVYLNAERSVTETAHPDVAFASKAPSMLSRYSAMPLNQYRRNYVNETADSISMYIANLGDIPYNITYKYEVTDSEGDIIEVYDPGNFSIPPYSEVGYLDYPLFSKPPVEFVFPINDPEPVVFTTTHILSTQANLERRSNDTVRNVQLFSNYYAYDDGTAEAGYGITPSGAQVAYQFQMNENDSLFGVNMYFNQTLTQGNVNNFYLNVWNDDAGEPGDLIYSRFGYQPVMEDSLNKFFYYELDSAIYIERSRFPNLIFYVGWEQSNERVLNLGYDKNTDASDYIYFRTFGGWNKSQFTGALMIRPVVGVEKVLAKEELASNNSFSVYPNPVSNMTIRISSSIEKRNYSLNSVEIYSSDGRLVLKTPLNDDIDISSLNNGLYFIRIVGVTGALPSTKLIINK